MNKRFIGILSCFLLGLVIIANQIADAKTEYKYNKIPVKQPAVTANMKPAIAMYNQGNYVGAMLVLEEVVKKDKNNVYAKYYLALCYSQLGLVEDAQACFKEVVEADANYALTQYSKVAVACIEDPKSAECTPVKGKAVPSRNENEEEAVADENEDDITQFIKSGKKIHPAAMDKITNERMQRKIQAELYSLQQQTQEEQPQQEKPRRRHKPAQETAE